MAVHLEDLPEDKGDPPKVDLHKVVQVQVKDHPPMVDKVRAVAEVARVKVPRLAANLKARAMAEVARVKVPRLAANLKARAMAEVARVKDPRLAANLKVRAVKTNNADHPVPVPDNLKVHLPKAAVKAPARAVKLRVANPPRVRAGQLKVDLLRE